MLRVHLGDWAEGCMWVYASGPVIYSFSFFGGMSLFTILIHGPSLVAILRILKANHCSESLVCKKAQDASEGALKI